MSLYDQVCIAIIWVNLLKFFVPSVLQDEIK